MSLWPLDDLRIRTDRLELFLPDGDELEELAHLASVGIFRPDDPSDAVWSWHDPDNPTLTARNLMRHHWKRRAEWGPEGWRLNLAVRCDGRIVGQQDIGAEHFRVRREVRTSSWITPRRQGAGIGTEMRQAVLHFAFAELDAQWAVSEALAENAVSCRVSTKAGYLPDGIDIIVDGGIQRRLVRFRMHRSRWAAMTHPAVSVIGFDTATRAMFEEPDLELGLP